MTARLRTAAVIALALAAAAMLPAAASAAATSSADLGQSVPGELVPVLAGPDGPESFVDDTTAGLGADTSAALSATIRVTYHGFSPAAKASFQRAVNTWARSLDTRTPITINATYKPLGRGVLGQAGPSTFYRDFSGAPQRSTFYPLALANKLHGSRLSSKPDIVADFSSSFSNWWFGTGPAPQGKYDFQSVVTHELGHGVGFLGAGRIVSGKGTVKYDGYPTTYDHFTENAAGKGLLSFPNNSAALKSQLTGGNLYFDSKAVRSANGGNRARLFAPGSFKPGSTYSHLSESTYGRGNKNSLMTPYLGKRETIRTPGPIVLAALRSEGW